jgi:hypothetical protein
MSAKVEKPEPKVELPDAVNAWRLEQFLGMGFDLPVSETLADQLCIDLHRVRDLIAHGCSVDLAARIVS